MKAAGACRSVCTPRARRAGEKRPRNGRGAARGGERDTQEGRIVGMRAADGGLAKRGRSAGTVWVPGLAPREPRRERCETCREYSSQYESETPPKMAYGLYVWRMGRRPKEPNRSPPHPPSQPEGGHVET